MPTQCLSWQACMQGQKNMAAFVLSSTSHGMNTVSERTTGSRFQDPGSSSKTTLHICFLFIFNITIIITVLINTGQPTLYRILFVSCSSIIMFCPLQIFYHHTLSVNASDLTRGLPPVPPYIHLIIINWSSKGSKDYISPHGAVRRPSGPPPFHASGKRQQPQISDPG